jgi:hypothetical protein
MRLAYAGISAALALGLFFPSVLAAQQWIKTPDGRTILLNSDGTWEVLQSDSTAVSDIAPQSPKDQARNEDSKIRVLVTDSKSWETQGAVYGNNGAVAGYSAGGDRPQTAEIIKTISESCPELTVTSDRSKADYVLVLDHEGGKGWVRRDNKVALFNKDGDLVFSGSTRSLGSAVEDACTAIFRTSLIDPIVDNARWSGPYAAENGRLLKDLKNKLVQSDRGGERDLLHCFKSYLDLLDSQSLSAVANETEGLRLVQERQLADAKGFSCTTRIKDAYALLELPLRGK